MQSRETGVDADAELHFAIGQATQNQALEKLVSGLMEILSHSREESLQTLDRRKASIESHRKILAAIEQHEQDEGPRGDVPPHRAGRRRMCFQKESHRPIRNEQPFKK